MTDLPVSFESWPLEEKLAHFESRAQAMATAKEANPLGFYTPLRRAEDFHKSEKRNRLITGGNRSSKSYASAAEDLFWLLGKSPYRPIPQGGLQGVISSLSFGLFEQTLLPILQELMPKGAGWKLSYSRSAGGGEIVGPNGRAYIKSNDAGWQSYQGMALDFAHLDEEHDQEVYKQIRKRLKKNSKLNLWVSMTAEPDRPDHWTYEELAVPATDPKMKDDFAHFEFDLNDNRKSRGGYLDDSEVDYIISITPEDERPAVILGKYVRRGGLVYPMFSVDTHVEPERSVAEFLRGVKEGVYTPYAWLDWGVRNPCAIGLVLEDKDGICHLIDEIYRPARDVLDIKREYHKRFGAFGVVSVFADPSIWHNHDSTDPERTIAGQLERDDIGERLPGLPLYKASNDEVNGQAAVRELLRVHPVTGAKLRVQPRCFNWIREIGNYVNDEWAQRGYDKNKKEKARSKDNHHMDGTKYFSLSPHCYISPRWKRNTPKLQFSPVTGYVRPGVSR